MPVYLGKDKVGVVVSKRITQLPTLSNEGYAYDLMAGKQLLNDDGEVITGTYVPLDTSDATATADKIESGAIAYVNGEKITGTFSLESELAAQKALIAQIFAALEGKVAGNVIATHDGNGNVTLMNVSSSSDGDGNIILE